MIRIIYSLIFCFWVFQAYAWNAAGHKVVAQIAYDNLSPEAKVMCYKYLRSRTHNTPNSSFVSASTWMDEIRFREVYWYDVMHYIDIPFSTEEIDLPPVESTNAVWAIKQAMHVFSSKKTTPSEKRLALRMLIHITGDIHQPLHAVTRVSQEFPKGDLGGNLFPLGANPVGNNLHKYWDSGAGLFLGQYNAKKVKKTAHDLEQKLPCSRISTQIEPKKWAKMSHKLALKNAYQLNPKESPSTQYQENAQMLVQKQVVFAGCRLAVLLNKLAKA
ncbi:S1/P1 nuclease [Legionella cincinnatiensis]|uniref:3'-nucleotidase/nuclease n=1 Tax=Legionella cincinnatiensis TaxID=28085 RepID=A0A378IIL7_9GAMM|nr:S1/P1 nuclease [Legionella cincinnatiensis]KTC93290.1 3'-nucleotidase/nuclease [Legionella cincinnatiensis]STX35009.1 3'-nucleotidase/nuclease [Legionella cincinnatiensis]